MRNLLFKTLYYILGGFRNSLPDPQSLNTRSMSEIQSIIAAAADRNSGVQDAMANAKSKKRSKNRAEVVFYLVCLGQGGNVTIG